MQDKSFVRKCSYIFPIGLLTLLLSLPVGAQTNYTMDVVSPGYIEANTVLSIAGDDNYLHVLLPFPFTFYGITYNHAYVSTNGYLNFLGGNASYLNVPLPTTATPNGAIYPYWDDLYMDSVASVRTELLGTAPNQRFVIEWDNVRFYSDYSRRIDFEIVLYETGMILLQYRNIANDVREMGNSATVGIEDHTGTTAVQFSYNSGAIGPGEFAIRFAQPGRSVPADIKPMGCPNPLNVRSQGVLPFAIMGTADLDVTAIDPKSVTLAGVAPLRWSLEDAGTPYEPFTGKIDPYQCNDLGPDGIPDLVFKFDT